MDRTTRLAARRNARAEFLASAQREVVSRFPEVDHLGYGSQVSPRLIAWNRHLNMIAEATGRSLNESREKLLAALELRRERLAEAETQRALFSAAVR